MEIKRDKYLNELIKRKNNGMIKVITGIRRSGKTYLVFNIFYDYLISIGVKNNNIISLALDSIENEEYRDPYKLYDYIRNKITDDSKQYYILLDEIQYAITKEELRNNEKPPKLYEVLNSLLRRKNVDVYVTGSNSKLLSKDVMTEFRGRGDEVHIFPLSFKEFMSVYKGDIYHGWADYSTYGGLPKVLSFDDKKDKMKYLNILFEETYLLDVLDRNDIEKNNELECIVNLLASDIGSLTNPSKLERTFKSEMHSSISHNTISKYIDAISDSFLISQAYRYDVKGKKYISTPSKYYFEDLGLRNARLRFRQYDESHIMENIIYNELRMRGYSVDVGIIEKRIKKDKSLSRVQYEIDFIANQGDEKLYIQSAMSLPDLKKQEHETRSLKEINDNFKKIVIVKDITNKTINEDGIIFINLFDFLLEK